MDEQDFDQKLYNDPTSLRDIFERERIPSLSQVIGDRLTATLQTKEVFKAFERQQKELLRSENAQPMAINSEDTSFRMARATEMREYAKYYLGVPQPPPAEESL